MAKHQLIVTEVTRYGDLFCVAGWDVQRKMMVRPEPPGASAAYPPSRFWKADYAGNGRVFEVGNVVTLAATRDPPPDFLYPHRTEDRIVAPGSNLNLDGQLPLEDVVTHVAGSVSLNPKAVFDGGLTRDWTGGGPTKAHVPLGYNGRSLGAVNVTPNRLRFAESAYDPNKPQLRAILQEGVTKYDLSVTSDSLKSIWRAGGLEAVRLKLQEASGVHVRLGLARAFDAKPDKCYAQVNGIIFLK